MEWIPQVLLLLFLLFLVHLFRFCCGNMRRAQIYIMHTPYADVLFFSFTRKPLYEIERSYAFRFDWMRPLWFASSLGVSVFISAFLILFIFSSSFIVSHIISVHRITISQHYYYKMYVKIERDGLRHTQLQMKLKLYTLRWAYLLLQPAQSTVFFDLSFLRVLKLNETEKQKTHSLHSTLNLAVLQLANKYFNRRKQQTWFQWRSNKT